MILLIAGYMLCGAAVFQMIESDSRVGLAARAIEAGNKKDFKWKINSVYLIFLMLQPSVLFASLPIWRREILLSPLEIQNIQQMWGLLQDYKKTNGSRPNKMTS